MDKAPCGLSFLLVMLMLATSAFVLQKGIEREERRREIVTQVMCQTYGEAMNKYAIEIGGETPCQ